MSYATADIATTLRAARETKGLSQRELSRLAGVPQGHISKIESGAVDLRVSSLVALARVLELELTLVPRKSVPAVQSVVRSTGQGTRALAEAASGAALKEIARLDKQLAGIIPSFPANTELAQIRRQIRDLQHLRIPPDALGQLRDANKALKELSSSHNLETIRRTLSDLQTLRNAAAHSTPNIPPADTGRPAYSLDEDDHG